MPYLGIFLTDLTMLDAAVKDRLEVRQTGRRTHQIRKYPYNIHKKYFFPSEWLYQLRQTATSEFYFFLLFRCLICFENIFLRSCAEMDYFLSFWSLKEFEVLAKIRLLQSSCRNSTFRTDESFVYWYHSVPTLTEEER